MAAVQNTLANDLMDFRYSKTRAESAEALNPRPELCLLLRRAKSQTQMPQPQPCRSQLKCFGELMIDFVHKIGSLLL